MRSIPKILTALMLVIMSFVLIVVIDEDICIAFSFVLAAGLIMFFSEIKRLLGHRREIK